MWIEVRQWLFFSNFVSWPSSYVNMQISFRTITDEKRILGSLFNLFCICLSSKWMCVTLKIKKVQLQKCKKFIFRCPKLEGYALSNFVNSSNAKNLEPLLLHSKKCRTFKSNLTITQKWSLEFWFEIFLDNEWFDAKLLPFCGYYKDVFWPCFIRCLPV